MGVVAAKALVLDVNETLFSLESLDALFANWGVPDGRELWFARTLRNGFALTCAGTYRIFPEVAGSALISLAPERLGDEQVREFFDAFGQSTPHPEVADALSRARSAGIDMVTLSVGNASNVELLFQRAGMADLVTRHLSCEDVHRWKPSPEPYLLACRALETDPAATWMVAAHAWDLAGARSVGMKTAWLSRLEGEFDANFGAPDVSGRDMREVIDRLVAD